MGDSRGIGDGSEQTHWFVSNLHLHLHLQSCIGARKAHVLQTLRPTVPRFRNPRVCGRRTVRSLASRLRVEKVRAHLSTKVLECGIDLLFSLLVPVNQEIQHVNCLDHAIERRQIAFGRRDEVPAGLASNPDLDTAILRLTIGIMCDIVDDNALRRGVRIEN